ncbi:MAG: endonuclease/exonuclease/phosphatase family protein [Candidatus Hodarchaeota archaeon]
MAKIRIATFNVENLLQRFNFYSYGKLKTERALRLLGVDTFEEDMMLRNAFNVSLTDDSRQMTAQAIRDTEADIIALQEIENKEILDDFHEFYLKKSAGVNYGWRRLIEGNDRRGIDVAVMSKPRIKVQSHAEKTFGELNLFNNDLEEYGESPGDRVFRRDCLEVEVKINDKILALFICHLKSLCNGRDETMPIRLAEAETVRKIIEDKFGDNVSEADWIILGDMNDYIFHQGNPVQKHGIEPFFRDNFSVNLVDNLPQKDRWTHYFPKDGTFHQFDYILVSPGIAAKNQNVKPDIIRHGLPDRVPGIEKLYRYSRMGFDRPKASDHCPVAVTLSI